MRKGTITGIAAFVIWGVLPIYWKLIKDVPADEIVGHRIAWSFLLMVVVILIRKEGQILLASFKKWRSTITFLFSALLLCINWLVYIWAVNSGFIVDASLGYFINPLVNVVFGVVFLKERLRIWQWVSVFLAFLGVLYLTLRLGSVPWIGLVLAMTFGSYGLIRKRVTERSVYGFTLETAFMFLPAFIYLVGLEIRGGGSFGHGDISKSILLITTGAITAIPLVLFGSAVQLVRLTTLGFMQYIAPTLQFLIGILVYGEEFSLEKMVGYGIIWFALAIFSLDGVLYRQATVNGRKQKDR